ncbi:VOC family protein [Saccharospirillum salsuginis]|uniref:VOC domain-containing protein n=1 Tax=Saccharospirillum salsuginis TaxID=418750 RepID=A0A918NIK2_9GAMM|nr:VOC family protein [Saccharospirillum salsuginis]GGX75846.1 hypothetical protein GCM10007392_48560 [Saccharospirillum salsuginis]
MATSFQHAVWFEIPVTDMDRAIAFYEAVFETELKRQEMGPLTMAWLPSEQGQYGASGTLMLAESYVPSHQGSMVYLNTDDIDATLGRAEAQGGKILNPKMSIGEFGFVGHFEDSEGNRIGLHNTQ